jgi:hypothetical protein
MTERLQLAEVNIARMLAPIDDPIMAGFVALLDEINALADRSSGFVWRFQTPEGNANYLRPYDDDRILFNLSVWESVEQLKDYAYRSAHGDVFRRRREWFSNFGDFQLAMWWVPEGHRPSVAEGKYRLEYLQQHGPTPHAFTFRSVYGPEDVRNHPVVAPHFEPCAAI